MYNYIFNTGVQYQCGTPEHTTCIVIKIGVNNQV